MLPPCLDPAAGTATCNLQGTASAPPCSADCRAGPQVPATIASGSSAPVRRDRQGEAVASMTVEAGLSSRPPSITRATSLRSDAAASAADGGVEIGRAHVGTPVPNAHLVCRLLLA